MTWISSLLHFNFTSFLLAAGYIGLFAGVFAETGFLIGLFLPGGETLIFTASILASLGFFNIWIVAGISLFAAIFADSLEYTFGKRYGPRVFAREGSKWFDTTYIDRSRTFFETYGAKTVLFARFLPFIRTLAPAFAGVGNMGYSRFAFYNIVGAALWVGVMCASGYWLGAAFPRADQYLAAAVVAIAIISTGASWLTVRRHRKQGL